MSDPAHSTLSSPAAELDALIRHGFPPVAGPSEEQMRARAHDLAMGVAYTWLTRDQAARDEFIDEIVNMSVEGTGITLAIDLLTDIRLFGVAPGTVQTPVEVPPRGELSASEFGDERHYRLAVDVVTDLWTGIATGNVGRSARARINLAEMSLDDVRDVLRVMTYDTSQAMEQFAIWRSAGADLLDTYRRDNPPPNPLLPQ